MEIVSNASIIKMIAHDENIYQKNQKDLLIFKKIVRLQAFENRRLVNIIRQQQQQQRQIIHNKDCYLTCYSQMKSNVQQIKIIQTQFDTLTTYDQIQKTFADERLTGATRHKYTRICWLKFAAKLFRIRINERFNVWHKLKEFYPHICYGFRFLHKSRTSIERLTKRELIKKFKVDTIINANINADNNAFVSLGLRDAKDVLQRCYIPSCKVHSKLFEIVSATITRVEETQQQQQHNNHTESARAIVKSYFQN